MLSTHNIPSSVRFRQGSTITPGDRIGNSSQVISGSGTYLKGLHVYASLAGSLRITYPSSSEIKLNGTNAASALATVSVYSKSKSDKNILNKKSTTNQIPHVNHIVLGRIVRISTHQAIVEILASSNSGGPFLPPYFGGIIRKEDIRSRSTEDIMMAQQFQPGDVILAKVLSLGDARRYYLTTTENDLGVIRANCKISGEKMVPISWKEMECPVTKVREGRKCARPKDVSIPN